MGQWSSCGLIGLVLVVDQGTGNGFWRDLASLRSMRPFLAVAQSNDCERVFDRVYGTRVSAVYGDGSLGMLDLIAILCEARRRPRVLRFVGCVDRMLGPAPL